MDGPFAGLASEVRSPDDNYFIFARYEYLLDLHVFEAQEPWESEAHKRTKVARLAKEVFPRANRCLVIDNDECLVSNIPHGYPLRAALHQDGLRTASMIRVYPLTPTITWGPNHGRVVDQGKIYWDARDDDGRTPDYTWPGLPCDFDILHTPADKRIQEEYNQYNGHIRPGIEE